MTVTIAPHEGVRSRLGSARPRRRWALVPPALAVLGATLAAVLVGSGSHTRPPAAAVATRPAPATAATRPGTAAAATRPATPAAAAEIAAAYGYPLGCLRITIAAADPAYARAHLDRTSAGGCARYRGYLNASLHRVDGTWRLVLDEGQLFVPNDLLARCRGTGCQGRRRPARRPGFDKRSARRPADARVVLWMIASWMK